MAPILLRDQIARAIGAVSMGIDEAGHDHLACNVDDRRAFGNIGFTCRTNRCNPVTTDHHGGIIDSAGIILSKACRHGQHARTGQRHCAAWLEGINR